MGPFEAQFEQCAAAALKGDIPACRTFIRWSLREGLVAPAEPYDDHQYVVTVPKDWNGKEFVEMYRRFGPPPWPGERDGLTQEGRAERQASRKRKAKRRS